MVTIHDIDETFAFYATLGAARRDTGNGTWFTFPGQASHVRFWGDLHGFCVADVDVTFPHAIITRSQFRQRYIGISFTEKGHVITYNRKAQARESRIGVDYYVFHSPAPHFMKIAGGQRLRYHGMYFQEAFFKNNGIPLYDSFWEDARHSLACKAARSPELFSIYQHVEKCPLTGSAFQVWMRGQGLAAAGYLLDLVQRHACAPHIYLSRDELAAVERAKRLIKENLSDMPTILELCRRVALNKNKLQKAFRLTEGKSVGEYVRTLRMELALELLEKSEMTVFEVSKAVGYHGISNFYHAFQQKFGETPQSVREMLQGH